MASSFSRRHFGQLALSTALGAVAAHPLAQAEAAAASRESFPAGFLWGTATAAYQVEGAAQVDGRGASIWDTFSHTLGKIADSSSGDTADDEFHRFGDDIRILKLGADAPHFTAAEMKAIGSPLDFVGLNIYQPAYVLPAESGLGYRMVQPSATFPRMLSPWLTIGPECLYWAPRLAAETWKLRSIFITENGCLGQLMRRPPPARCSTSTA